MSPFTIRYSIHTRARDSGTSYTREVSVQLDKDDNPVEVTDQIKDFMDELFDATEDRRRRRRER